MWGTSLERPPERDMTPKSKYRIFWILSYLSYSLKCGGSQLEIKLWFLGQSGLKWLESRCHRGDIDFFAPYELTHSKHIYVRMYVLLLLHSLSLSNLTDNSWLENVIFPPSNSYILHYASLSDFIDLIFDRSKTLNFTY